MVEREPMRENRESNKERLIRLLKEKGPEDSEAKDLLIQWTIEQEKKVESSKDPEAPINFNLERARLYFESGFTEEAFENFDAALEQAWNEHKDELYHLITQEMVEKGLIKEEE